MVVGNLAGQADRGTRLTDAPHRKHPHAGSLLTAMADLQILDAHIRADHLPSERQIHAEEAPFLALQSGL